MPPNRAARHRDVDVADLEREYDALINRERELSERAADNAREAERYEMEA